MLIFQDHHQKPVPKDTFVKIEVTADNVDTPIALPDDFVAFSDDIVRYSDGNLRNDVGDEYIEYYGYNQVICRYIGTYFVPYKARWFFFTKDLHNATTITAPADVCEALPSYIASQCMKIDDEVKAAIYRNEFEMFLARIDDTSFKSQRTFHIGGGW